jgi:tetratricopeptide (TPR) repeat protein
MPNGEIELGKSLLSRAMELGPNLVEAWARAGWAWLWTGELETAIMQLAGAERLDPLAPTIVATWTAQGAVHFFSRRLDAAVPILRRAIARAPDWAPPRVYLAVALVELGLLQEARAEALALLALQPNRTIRRTRETNPYKPAWMQDMLYGSMRQAGIPEE